MKILITILLFLISFKVFAQKYDVRVLEYSTVRVGEPIRLGHIIDGAIADAELAKRISDVLVYESLKEEGVVAVSSQEIAVALRNKVAFQDLQRISIKIPEIVRLKAKMNYLPPQEIKNQIVQTAQNLCNPCDISFEELKTPELTGREEMLSWKMDFSQFRLGSSFLIPMHVETSQGKTTLWVTGRMNIFKEAPVAKRMIKMGERISESDFEIKKINVTTARDGFLSSEKLIGQAVNRVIALGQPIFAGDLKKEFAAQRGQNVKILVGAEAIEITAQGTAEESGNIGDTIKVKSAETKKMLSGVLIEKGVVRVE